MKRQNVAIARRLRKEQTDAEKRLWGLLRDRRLDGVKFRRQFPSAGYVLDFYSPGLKLCVEVDGGGHFEDEGIENDELRTKALAAAGIRVIRFTNLDILNNINGVAEEIQKALRE